MCQFRAPDQGRHGEPLGQEESASDGHRQGHSVAQDAAPQAVAVPEAAPHGDRAGERGGSGARAGEAPGPRSDCLEEEESAGGFVETGRGLA